VLIPSNWWENSPVVIQEAYAAGRPLVCTGIGGMAEKVKNGVSGLHFRLGDHADLISTLDKAADPDMFAQLAAGIPPVYDAAGMAREYLSAFRYFLGIPEQQGGSETTAPKARRA
jgi:glycosyltransferase involved in cell wall biosynthesis